MDAKQIEQVPLFAGLDKRERAHVAQHADEIDVPEGKRLAREGDLAYEFFVIREGTADVDVGGETKNKLGPDDFFGEIGDVADETRRHHGPRPASARPRYARGDRQAAVGLLRPRQRHVVTPHTPMLPGKPLP